MTQLPAALAQTLFEEAPTLSRSYDLTHALLALLWLKAGNPAIARQRHVNQSIAAINDKLRTRQTWDAFTSDIYNERIAFWLYMEDGPEIRQRWIERILLSQNKDGGWTFSPDPVRMVAQLLALDNRNGKSDPHATFLALYALVRYRELSGIARIE